MKENRIPEGPDTPKQERGEFHILVTTSRRQTDAGLTTPRHAVNRLRLITRPLSDGSEPARVSKLRQNLIILARQPTSTQTIRAVWCPLATAPLGSRTGGGRRMGTGTLATRSPRHAPAHPPAPLDSPSPVRAPAPRQSAAAAAAARPAESARVGNSRTRFRPGSNAPS